MSNTNYESPLSSRYASKEMKYIFSNEKKFRTWRRLWIALAKAEAKLGLDISDEQIAELISNQDNINYEVALAREKEVRHDVMSHVYAYGVQCPKARGIIHLGATSCYVGDNTDIIIISEGLKLIKKKLVNLIDRLSDFSDKYKNLSCLAFTHFQPAQPTTVGKRATLWIQDLISDLDELEYVNSKLCLLGSKGTTGTQAGFLELFEGDYNKVKKLDELICKEMGFSEAYKVSGQTYSRKVDSRVLDMLSHIAESVSKITNDIRLLQHLKEVEEPFEKSQIGSSAMAYKRNPMRCERIAGMARAVVSNTMNTHITAMTQWFERTLDDSSNRRLSISTSFLAIDGILDLMLNVTDGLVVYEEMIKRHLREELPFMATENIMMRAVKKGRDRQIIHEKIRELSMEAAKEIKLNGKDNPLLKLIAEDDEFGLSIDELNNMMVSGDFSGCASMQTDDYIKYVRNDVLSKYEDLIENLDIKINL